MSDHVLHMPLLGEGVEVWRPVPAEPLGTDRFRILGPVPKGERWTFAPGAIVRARRLGREGDFVLVAAALAGTEDGR